MRCIATSSGPFCTSTLIFLLIGLANRNILVYSHTGPLDSLARGSRYAPSRDGGFNAAQKSNAFTRRESLSQGRRSVTSSLWREFFTNGPGKATGYQSTALMNPNQNDWPVLGTAHSGGGERATLYGAAVLHALDARTANSPIRGVYDLASYTTGLSGGSWLLVSMAAQEYPTVPILISKLQTEIDVVLPGGSFKGSMKFLENLFFVVMQKQMAGFRTSMIDYWSIALGQHFLPPVTNDNFYSDSLTTPRGAGLLFSSFRNTTSLREFQKPLPIIVSNHQPLAADAPVNPTNLPIQGITSIPLSAPIYEYSPFEFGSFDPHLGAFIPTEYLGTGLQSGKPVVTKPKSPGLFTSWTPGSGGNCTRGFDQLSFIMGSSAAILNSVLGAGASALPPGYAQVMNYISSSLGGEQPLLAHYPNPFNGINGEMGFDRSNSDELLIVDGGENGENLPLNPLLAPARQVDVILAADASADTDSTYKYGANWPNGAAMINTWLRIHKVLPSGTSNFPPVPLQPQVWIDKGFNTRPTFFGCDATSTQGNGGYPLVVYLPNSPLSPSPTNTSTFKMQYSNGERDQFLSSAARSTIGPVFGANKTADPEWPTCLSCALIDRSRNRLNVIRSSACEKCFTRYCARF
ncbi:hypothetical protein PSHT_01937 [Puccinia striiformis]|uniref:Lysophospholipase n=1 Tax=Puccinia striiformis TaxID=27350 RepID=A0A2S4WJ40_9BASI|nr:hypothetical protein PSHT_01937 [Puccinia striiformis]